MEFVEIESDQKMVNCTLLSSDLLSDNTRKHLTLSYIILTMIISVLSIIGCLLIFYLYIFAKELRTPTRRMLVFLSISDLMIASGNICGAAWIIYHDNIKIGRAEVHNPTDNVCVFQAAVTSTACIASFFWTMFIALNGYLLLIVENKILIDRLWLIPHIVSWGVPMTVLIIVASEQRYGFDPCKATQWWCWVERKPELPPMQEQNEVVLWQLVSGKFWEISAYLFVAIVYSLIRYQLNRHVKRMERHRTEANRPIANDSSSPTALAFADANRKLIFVPAVFIVARIWGTLRFILDLINDDRSILMASYIAPLQGVGDSAQGLLNCMVFVWLTPVLREKLLSKLRKLCSCCSDHKPSNSIEGSSLSTEAVLSARGVTYGSIVPGPQTTAP